MPNGGCVGRWACIGYSRPRRLSGKDPIRWLQAISKCNVTVSVAQTLLAIFVRRKSTSMLVKKLTYGLFTLNSASTISAK